ncbi:acetylxylan esterase [Curtobacterium sp. 458]|uniref:acetylxylan esterase n=1 Tax=Curtobacterium sp. 458 TaxID=3050069 RepID=UPI0025B5A8B7|nr:acetylxylan esterase [Curtobacterium sp. 458]WJX99563.1 acetylxylan esterase [Curtobacterium sp. 458]
MYTDITGPELLTHRGSAVEPADFDAFWADTLASARQHPSAVELSRVDTGLSTLDTYDVSFAGWDGQRVRGWLTVPAGTAADAPLPAVVEYIGYGGGRGLATERLLWASAGYAHLVMDTRGQGSGWSVGDTPDPDGTGPAAPGVMTRGIESRETYYYRRLTVDAVRAVDAVRSIDLVDPERVAVVGVSQGGGLAIAVAGLVEGLAGVFPRVPFLCDFPRASVITDADPYREIARYLTVHRDRRDQVFGTLAYFDGALHAARATAPAWFSTALMDPICPPSTVYAAYNAYAGPKEITVWEYNGHEGGGAHEDTATLPRLASVLRGEQSRGGAEG